MKRFNIMDNGYRFDKLLIIAPIIILFILFIYALSTNGLVSHPYFKCKLDICKNPFMPANTIRQANNTDNQFVTQPIGEPEAPAYQDTCLGFCLKMKCDDAWCTQQFLTRGEYGTKPPLYLDSQLIGFTMVFIYALIFYLNHIFYNKGMKFSLSQKRQVFPGWMYKVMPKKWSESLRKAETEGLKEIIKDEEEKG